MTDEVPTDDDGVPVGWSMRPLLDRALPRLRPWARTPELAAFAFAEPCEFAVEAAMVRGWCTEAEADRWSTIGLLVFPWHIWPDWLERGMHPLDRLVPLEEWWRPAWEWAEANREASRVFHRHARRWRRRRRRATPAPIVQNVHDVAA